MCMTVSANCLWNVPATVSICSLAPSALTRTVRAPRRTGIVVSRVRASRSMRFGRSSAPPCATIVREVDRLAAGAAERKVSNPSHAFEYLEDVGASELRELAKHRGGGAGVD